MSSSVGDLKKPILALPSTADETINVDINDSYKLKELGPVGKFCLPKQRFLIENNTYF